MNIPGAPDVVRVAAASVLDGLEDREATLKARQGQHHSHRRLDDLPAETQAFFEAELAKAGEYFIVALIAHMRDWMLHSDELVGPMLEAAVRKYARDELGINRAPPPRRY